MLKPISPFSSDPRKLRNADEKVSDVKVVVATQPCKVITFCTLLQNHKIAALLFHILVPNHLLQNPNICTFFQCSDLYFASSCLPLLVRHFHIKQIFSVPVMSRRVRSGVKLRRATSRGFSQVQWSHPPSIELIIQPNKNHTLSFSGGPQTEHTYNHVEQNRLVCKSGFSN